MVHLESVRRQFGSLVLFEDLTWTIPAQARVGLVGPNGVGKTTLLRILAGLDEPDAGNVHRAASPTTGYLAQEVETLAGGSVLEAALGGLSEIERLERRLGETTRLMATLAPDDPALARATADYGELRQRFEALGGDRAEARARAVLTGLGVPPKRFHAPVAELSGGWRMRVALARLLVSPPSLILLDEPTNHLDLDALAWLEGFLATYDGAFVVVSHDRYFLNRVVRQIAELENGRLTVYPGGYDDYVEAKAARDAARAREAREQAREIARVERFVERFRYKASKARQAQSRIRSLDKTARIEAPRRSRRRLRFGFAAAPRSGEWVVRAQDASKAYGDRVVYRDLRLEVRRGDRVALVGANGTGKSTLLKMVAGIERPSRGSVELGHNVTVRYFAQHHLEALDPDRSALETLELVPGAPERARLRSLLGRFLFSGDAVQRKVAVLSGGEKARLALCRMLLYPANLLLLDEPTNHLDVAAREVLEEALDEYDGTLMFVSHDRYFINRLATSVAEIVNRGIELYPGDYDVFLERATSRQHEPQASREPAESPSGRPSRRDVRRLQAQERNAQYREQRATRARVEQLESEIARLEEALRELDALQSEPQIYRDAGKAAHAGRRRAEVERELAELYSRWESLAAELS